MTHPSQSCRCPDCRAGNAKRHRLWAAANRPRARAINRLWKRRQSLLRAYRAAMQGGLHRAYVRAMGGAV